MGLLAEAVFDQDSQAPRGPGRAADEPGRSPLAPCSRCCAAGLGLAFSDPESHPCTSASGHLGLCAVPSLPGLRGVLAELGSRDRPGSLLRAQLRRGALLRLLRRCRLVPVRTRCPTRCLSRSPREAGYWWDASRGPSPTLRLSGREPG